MDGLGGSGLMGVEAAYAFGSVGGGKVGIDPGREVRPLRFAGRKMTNRGEDFAGVVARSESIQHFVDAGDCSRQASSANSKRVRHPKPLSCNSLFIRQRYHRPFAGARRKIGELTPTKPGRAEHAGRLGK